MAARPVPPPPSASPASVPQKYFGDARERAQKGRAGPGERAREKTRERARERAREKWARERARERAQDMWNMWNIYIYIYRVYVCEFVGCL